MEVIEHLCYLPSGMTYYAKLVEVTKKLDKALLEKAQRLLTKPHVAPLTRRFNRTIDKMENLSPVKKYFLIAGITAMAVVGPPGSIPVFTALLYCRRARPKQE